MATLQSRVWYDALRRRVRALPPWGDWLLLAGSVLSAAMLLADVQPPALRTVAQGGGLVTLFIVLWASGRFPDHLIVALFYLLALSIEIAPPEIVFAGFASKATWLIFGGMVIGAAMQGVRLDRLIADFLVSRLRDSYSAVVGAIALVSLALCFLVPSTLGRVALLVPVAVAVSERLGLEKDGPGHTGIVLVVAVVSSLAAYAILPAAMPNLTMLGTAEAIYGISIGYGQYLAVNFPVIGAGTTALIVILVLRLMPDTPQPPAPADSPARLDRPQRRLLAVLLVTLAFWATDFWTGLHPAFVAMGSAVVCALPWMGFVSGRDLNTTLNLGIWLIVATLIGMGRMVDHTGLGVFLASELIASFNVGGGAEIGDVLAILGIGKAASLVTTTAAAPALMTPLAGRLADAAGLELLPVLMLQVPTWVFTLLPYECPPLALALMLGGVSFRRAARVLAVFAVAGAAVLLPLHFLWLRILGYLA